MKDVKQMLLIDGFLRINFDEKVPDHSTYSQNLKRKFLETNLFKDIFMHIISQAYDAGFIDPQNVFGDSTHVKANANKKKHKDTIVKITENIYYDDLKKDINNDRLEHNKKNLILMMIMKSQMIQIQHHVMMI